MNTKPHPTTSLISAEEMAHNFEFGYKTSHTEDYVINSIRAIQLNALKAAAEISAKYTTDHRDVPGDRQNATVSLIRSHILSLAKQVEDGKQICDGKESK